jgi:mannose-6-phosphate isomerase-like protein (cupin superfamily)
MDIESIKASIVSHVYHIPSDKKVPMHKHDGQDEVFYCIKGSGFGVLEEREVALSVGQAFIVPAGTMHSVRSDSEVDVTAFLIPVVDGRLSRPK